MSEHYGYGEQPENPSVHELANRAKKKQQIDNSSGSWRDNTNRGTDFDDVFRTISNAAKPRKQTRIY